MEEQSSKKPTEGTGVSDVPGQAPSGPMVEVWAGPRLEVATAKQADDSIRLKLSLDSNLRNPDELISSESNWSRQLIVRNGQYALRDEAFLSNPEFTQDSPDSIFLAFVRADSYHP